MKIDGCAFSFSYSPNDSAPHARLLLQSLERWLSQEDGAEIPVYVVEHATQGQALNHREISNPYSVFRLDGDKELFHFPYIEKVLAAAMVESIAEENGITQLIHMDWDTIILQDPVELCLEEPFKVAVSPVQLRNISSLASEAMDGFWQRIYEGCQAVDDPDFRVTSMIDHQVIRPHFNAGLMVINPKSGLFRQWKQNFLTLYQDPILETFYALDRRYYIFAHQAILAATLLSKFSPHEIKLLPSTYNYPLFLLPQAPPNDRPANLESLVSVRYEDFYPLDWTEYLPCEPSLRKWLDTAIQKAQ